MDPRQARVFDNQSKNGEKATLQKSYLQIICGELYSLFI